MAAAPPNDDDRSWLGRRFALSSTSAKLLAIITLALMPLGIIALLASLQASRNADAQRRSDLHVAATESTRNLGAQLAADVAAMTSAVNALEAGGAQGEICGRFATVILARSQRATPFAIYGPAGLACRGRGAPPPRPARRLLDSAPEAVVGDTALEIRIPSRGGGWIVVADYSKAQLGDFATPTGFSGDYDLVLESGDAVLALDTPGPSRRSLSLDYDAPVGLFGLALGMTIDATAFGATAALLTFLPLLMWASAALIGFLVVDRLLIRPLESLRRAVGAHVPGAPFRPPAMRTPALEIRDLAETIGGYIDQAGAHEAEAAALLAHQTRLTREVHHRVKNNLQVIASLISLHSRAARNPEVIAAYASIQRRVDALAIVHRNHYAGIDEERGIDLKTLIGELAANLRASAPDNAAPPISVAAAPLKVTQDSAVAMAFLLTELTELAMAINGAAPIAIAAAALGDGRGQLSIASTALRDSESLTARLDLRYRRVIEALARQMRATLAYDAAAGSYGIEFPTVST